MNSFEKMISKLYVEHHSQEIVQAANDVASNYPSDEDRKSVYQHELQLLAFYRFTYLAISEYHNALASKLKTHGVDLPALEDLFDNL